MVCLCGVSHWTTGCLGLVMSQLLAFWRKIHGKLGFFSVVVDSVYASGFLLIVELRPLLMQIF